MDKGTKEVVTIIVIGFFTLTVCALVIWHAFANLQMDALEQTLVMVLIALAAALGGIQLPTVLGKSNGKSKDSDTNGGPGNPKTPRVS